MYFTITPASTKFEIVIFSLVKTFIIKEHKNLDLLGNFHVKGRLKYVCSLTKAKPIVFKMNTNYCYK